MNKMIKRLAAMATPANHTATLPVMEAFYTLQGEGYHQGRAAYFIRLAGCDVGCVWCDVKESWEETAHARQPVSNLVSDAKKHPARIAVITGGEPLMHPLTPLTRSLREAGFQTHLETSGSWPLSGDWDWICLSPKKFKAPLPEIIHQAHELKVVVFNDSDFAWAEQFARQTAPHCRLYLQPEWSRSQKMLPKITQYIMENPQWEISLQLHKYMNLP